MQKTSILDYLQNQLPQERIYFHPNPGNAGDSLIACASFQLFRKLSSDIETINPYERFDSRGKTIIYGGGGNLTRYYDSAKQPILHYQEHAKRLILLPHTIDQNEQMLNCLKGNVTLFCRENVSYNHVKKYAKKAEVLAADDMVFSLDVDEVMCTNQMLRIKAICQSAARHFFIKPRQTGKIYVRPFLRVFYPVLWIKLCRQGIAAAAKEKQVLNSFRTDIERTVISLPPNNFDIGGYFAYGSSTEALSYLASNRLLRYIDYHSKVRTNRLHVAIAGALLGKCVELYANSYFKCRAVYEFSIKDRFPKVVWGEQYST
jgi:exopolysaccharide biosynthesis predicted pyruvyltransferase EpsI